MANEFRKVTDQNGVVHPVCDDTRMTWEANAKTGVHNQFQIPTSVVSKATDGVIFTVNRNNAGQVTSINASRASANNNDAYLTLDTAYEITEPKILSGCPTGGGDNKIRLVAYDGANFYLDEGNGVLLPHAGTYNINIRYFSAYNESVTLYPMLRDVEDTLTDFTPYAMTNRELTDAVNVINAGTIDLSHSESTTTSSLNTGRAHLEKVGKLCVLDLWVNTVTIADLNTFKEICRVSLKPTKETPISYITVGGKPYTGVIDTIGIVKIFTSSALSSDNITGQAIYYTND